MKQYLKPEMEVLLITQDLLTVSNGGIQSLNGSDIVFDWDNGGL